MGLSTKDMHIGLDLGLQQLNSNVFSKSPREAKDYALNQTIIQRYTDLAIEAQNVVSNELTYAEILKFYGKLTPLLYVKNINVYPGDARYVYANLPLDDGNQINSGRLIAGVEYQFLQAGGGSADFANVGATSGTNVGDSFTCTIDNLTSTGAAIPTIEGDEYRVDINSYDLDVISLGARANAVGVWFTSAGGNTGDMTPPNGTILSLAILQTEPTNWGNAILAPKFNYGCLGYLTSKSLVDVGNSLTSGLLIKGKMYKVVTSSTVDLSGYGGMATPLAGYIFNCTVTGTPSWDATLELTEVAFKGNDLVKIQDTENFLDNAFGTTINNPIAEIADNKIDVFHQGEFTINYIQLVYVRYPIKLNYNATINSELSYNELTKIVDLTVQRLAIRTNNPIAPVLAQENSIKL